MVKHSVAVLLLLFLSFNLDLFSAASDTLVYHLGPQGNFTSQILFFVGANMVKHSVAVILLLCFCFSLNLFSAASDTFIQGQWFTNNQTIVSAGDVLSWDSLIYWEYGTKKIPKEKQTAVWVPNRDFPFSSSKIFRVFDDGNFGVISDYQIYNITNVSSNGNSSMTLSDSGNLMLQDSNSQMLWQSFTHPTNTFLPGMKLGYKNRQEKLGLCYHGKMMNILGPGHFLY